MRKIALIGRWLIVVSLLLAGVTIPRFIFAEEHYENPFSAKAATLPSWDLKNPDAKYAIASDICPGLSLSQLATQAMSSDEGQSKSAVAATGSTIDELMLEKWHAEQQSQIQEEFWADARRVGWCRRILIWRWKMMGCARGEIERSAWC